MPGRAPAPAWRSAALAIIVLLAPAPAAVAQPAGPPRSPRNANYAIDVTLDPAARRLQAHERISWRNITAHPTGELQFHVYWNAWTDTRSTWMRERHGRAPVSVPDDDLAQIDISSLRLADGTDLLPTRRFLSPDDGNADDRTVLAVTLPEPARPGDTVVLELTWTARVPRTFDRTGAVGNYFFIAQWFPKLGVLEDSGWNCHQFHWQTEFFSDFGVYDVSLTVPRGWIVGATGRETQASDTGNGTTTHRYVQEDVHDFAWTTSPDFDVRSAVFDDPALPAVALRLLLQPEHLAQAERHVAAARHALRTYGSWFGPYPYGHLTIVDPAFQSGTDGMEYPTIFTAGTKWWITQAVTSYTPEEAVVHEAGHQFWQGIVGTNEFEHAWMDEGITTFATARTLAAAYPDMFESRYYFGGFVPYVFRDVRLRRETDLDRLWEYREGAAADTLASPSFRQRPEAVRFLAYDKPAVWLHTLERWLGWPALQHALARTFQEGAFSHPGPSVVLDAIGATAGRDVSRFMDQTFHGSALFDYRVGALSSEPTAGRSGQFDTRVLVERLQDGVFPVRVHVTFEDGTAVDEQWDGVARWREFSYTTRSRARTALVDPDRTLLLDLKFTNNSRTLSPHAPAAATTWSLRWLVWLQDALLTWGLLA